MEILTHGYTLKEVLGTQFKRQRLRRICNTDYDFGHHVQDVYRRSEQKSYNPLKSSSLHRAATWPMTLNT